MIKIAYTYHPETLQYTGTINAFIDTVRSDAEQKEIYILPSNATFNPPPVVENHQSLRISKDDAKWEIVEDYSRTKLWNKSTLQPAFLEFMEKLPHDLTTYEPLEKKEGFDNVFNEIYDKWELKPDFRGKTYFKKETGESVLIEDVGDIPANLTDKNKPDIFYVWSNTKNNWVIDKSLKQDVVIAQNVGKKENLKADAEERITLLERKVKLKRAIDEDLAMLDSLYGFTIDLDELDLADEKLVFPEMPV